jgi:hypothetical protein
MCRQFQRLVGVAARFAVDDKLRVRRCRDELDRGEFRL